MTARSEQSGFTEMFTPKLVTILRDRYGLDDFRADAVAGLTVAVVALPLSMAIAIGSGVSPDRGLYTAIIGGFIVSALGGSRFQIGGPAGAFIVLVSATVAIHGIDGLILATLLAGLMMMAIGFLRLGTYIKYIPYPVTVGFTSGIAVVIFASQLKELLGLELAAIEPGPIIPKLQSLGAALPTVNFASVTVASCSIALTLLVRRFRPHWPAFVVAITAAALLTSAFGPEVATIGTRFGGIPGSLPMPRLPEPSLAKLVAVFPAAISFALLGSIESLLSAVVADSMTGRRHRSNAELVAQGFANIGSALFGGFCVTGTIARTATNVRAGARGPVSGMLHSVFLLAFLMLAAPLASYIPLPALAGVLVIVCWSMADKHEFGVLLRASRGDAVVLLTTFLFVVFRDLTVGILVGFALGTLIFLHRMAQAVEVEHSRPLTGEDWDDSADGEGRTRYDSELATDSDIVICRISGAFFFGAAATVGAALDSIGDQPKTYIVDFSDVTLLDSSAAATIAGLASRAARHGADLYLTGARPAVRRILLTHGLRPPEVRYQADIGSAIIDSRNPGISSSPADRSAD